MSVLYESGSVGPDGEWVENTAWEIGMLMTVHRDGCPVLEELQRTGVSMRHDQRERLLLARKVECTCGAGRTEPNRLPVQAQPCRTEQGGLHLTKDRENTLCGRGVIAMGTS